MFSRLIPAAHATSVVAAIAHVVSLLVVSGPIGFEALGILVLTYVMTLAAAIPFGIALLAMVGLFKLGLKLSLVLFLIAAPLAVILVSTILFGYDPASIPLEYAYMAIPSALSAWYFSVYHAWKEANIK